MRLDESDELRVRRRSDVVDADAAVRGRQPVALAGLDLGIHQHEIADDAHLVRMRPRVRGHEAAEDLGLPWVGNLEDRRAFGPVLMPDISKSPLNYDLSAARHLHAAEMANILGSVGADTDIPMRRRQNLRHI
jgi:hypothetical protein